MKKEFKADDRILVNILGWDVGFSRNKGTQYVRVTFNNRISWTGWITPKTMKRTIETLGLMGFKGSDLSKLGNDDALDTSIEYIAVIDESREYKGKKYYSAKFINSNKAFGFNEKSRSTLDKFKDIDTRAYLDDVKDDQGGDQFSNDFGGSGFTTDDIPF